MNEVISLIIKSDDFLKRYKNGEYFALDVDKLAPITYRNSSSLIREVISSDSDSGYYSVRNAMNEEIIIANTGHSDVELAKRGLPIVGARCFYCTRDVKKPIGYPVKTKRVFYSYREIYHVSVIYWTKGRFCDLRCAYAHLLNQRSTTMAEMFIQLLKALAFQLGYEDIRPANDMMLLKSNGGILDDNKWSDRKLEFLPQEGLILLPAEQAYVETKVSRLSI